MDEFQAGDLVELKSGGPVMVIGRIKAPDKEAVCFWFGNDELNSDYGFPFEFSFNLACLVKAKNQSS